MFHSKLESFVKEKRHLKSEKYNVFVKYFQEVKESGKLIKFKIDNDVFVNILNNSIRIAKL